MLRPGVESDTGIVKSMSAEMARAVDSALTREGMIMAITDQNNANNMENIPGAIGSITLAQIISEQHALKPLVLDRKSVV